MCAESNEWLYRTACSEGFYMENVWVCFMILLHEHALSGVCVWGVCVCVCVMCDGV